MEGSNQPIRIPGRITQGPGALMRQSEDVQRAIQQLAARQRINERQPPEWTPPFAPLTPHYLRSGGGSWFINFRPTKFYEIYPVDPAAPVQERDIYIGATEITAATPPSLTLSLAAGVSWNYLHFKTDNKGRNNVDLGSPAGRFVEILSFDSEQDSTHHELPDENGSGGAQGDYYLLIFKTESHATGVKLDRSGIRRNPVWVRGYNALRNLGGGAKIYAGYDLAADYKDLRSVTGGYGITTTSTATEIDQSFDGANVGAGVEIYDDAKPNAEADFRTLIERDPKVPEIHVRAPVAGEIKIEGNDNDSTVTFLECDAVTVKHSFTFSDGLYTGANGTVLVPDCGASTSYGDLVHDRANIQIMDRFGKVIATRY